MSALLKQLHAMSINKVQPPDELLALYNWIEENGFIEEYNDGFLYGRISHDWEYTPDITFTASYQESIHHWFDLPTVTEEIASRLVIFASSGMDGSMLGLWLDDDKQVRFVHLGSGSGSMLCCIIADNARDFLSLLAIGYAEVGDVYDFFLPPEELGDKPKLNTLFLDWLKREFYITRPRNASLIVKRPAEIGSKIAKDPFCQWCNKQFKNT
ncbi:hypothetical protein [Hafnia paralvei]|uniref:hypothetical protein n=1 Tax=Hafnia paralvei TaxID=546367 RepID=UPI00163C40D2|nr:hypothetical protein [Hafnia paralvei]